MTCSYDDLAGLMFWAALFIIAIIVVAAHAWRYAQGGE